MAEDEVSTGTEGEAEADGGGGILFTSSSLVDPATIIAPRWTNAISKSSTHPSCFSGFRVELGVAALNVPGSEELTIEHNRLSLGTEQRTGDTGAGA